MLEALAALSAPLSPMRRFAGLAVASCNTAFIVGAGVLGYGDERLHSLGGLVAAAVEGAIMISIATGRWNR